MYENFGKGWLPVKPIRRIRARRRREIVKGFTGPVALREIMKYASTLYPVQIDVQHLDRMKR